MVADNVCCYAFHVELSEMSRFRTPGLCPGCAAEDTTPLGLAEWLGTVSQGRCSFLAPTLGWGTYPRWGWIAAQSPRRAERRPVISGIVTDAGMQRGWHCIPRGFCPLAQGWPEERRPTLGTVRDEIRLPQRGCVGVRPWDISPLRNKGDKSNFCTGSGKGAIPDFRRW